MSKKILTIVSIVMALVFVLILAMMFDLISTEGNNSVNNFSETHNTIISNELKAYDNKIVTGAIVKNTIDTFKETNDGLPMRYAVCNSTTLTTSANWTFYGYGGLAFSSSASGYVQVNTPGTSYSTYSSKNYGVTNTSFISDNSRYKASIIKTSNGVVTGIKFLLQ